MSKGKTDTHTDEIVSDGREDEKWRESEGDR